MTRYKLARALAAVACMVGGGLVALGVASPASAAEDNHIKSACASVSEWYVNPDESPDLKPESTEAGLKFEGKDLVHHATSPIDLADMDKVSYSFVTSNSGKVVFKTETDVPYSTIVTNADGKLWSTAMTYDQTGGQGHPVAKYSDLIGLPTKPGKAQYSASTNVVTFGVGYAVEEGSAVVSSITFHGTKYSLTCKAEPTGTPTAQPTAQPTGTPTAGPGTGNPSTSPSVGTGVGGGPDKQLPRTGPGATLLKVGGGALVGGLVLVSVIYAYSRRKRTTYIAG